MNNYKKYIKYKNKYLILKNQLGSSNSTVDILVGLNNETQRQKIIYKRMTRELLTLKSDEYIDFKFDLTLMILTFTRASDNSLIKVDISNDYPYTFPIIWINSKRLDTSTLNNPLSVKIIDIINTLESQIIDTNKKVLILCHRDIVSGSYNPPVLNNHWIGIHPFTIFQKIVESNNLIGNPYFETIDILPGGTYQQNAFSDEFIEDHIEDYDLVLVPDCDGEWSTLIGGCDKDKTQLILLCIKLTRIVKQGGVLFFSKFVSEIPCTIYDMEFETFSAALIHYLHINEFTTSTIDLTSDLGRGMIGLNAVKN